MNKTFAALTLAAVLGLGASAAQAKDLTGWFVNGGVGTAHYHATYGSYDLGSESDTSAQINFGWRSQF
ncbi:MAG TPA: porin family protein, partial [Rhodanobacteraceae bacterium]|nr:porin family protein [Rhodanobacteraceae bacterium]